jgi:polysaccharide biosynthesis transport protein
MDTDIKSLSDIVDILKRRKYSIILPALIIFVAAAGAAIALPRTYKSTSTILIEEQEIPREFVTTTVTGYAEQRLQTINQRVMSSTKLLEIITRFGLYQELKDRWTTEEIVDRMRKNIRFETISADVVDPRTGRASAATIAFSLSFVGEKPAVVQQIANMLASLYLEENLRVREEQTSGTTKFLEEELKSVQTSLAAIDGRVAVFKRGHLDSLPELSQVNLQGADRLDVDIDRLNDTYRTLREKQSYLQTQLASTPAESVDVDRKRLKELRVQLVNLRSRFSDEYPDVIKTRSEIEELERQLRSFGRDVASTNPDNPAYIALNSQLAIIREEIESVRRQIALAGKKKDDFRRRIEASPRVEEGYKSLIVERNNLQLKYDDLMRKHMEAKVAHGLEKEQKGERFTIIDSARLPERPVSPNVPVILLIGLVLGVGGGVSMASLREFGDQSVRTPEALSRATGFPVLAGIPEIVTWQETARTKNRRIYVMIGAVLAVVFVILLFHFFIMDLEVFRARLMRRMGI